ncbi:CCHC-type domain-containing protein [Mycena indigotica]|uniref:CCHC-type domain-containing protein n=1 Tax=Mycena indigotica TaxID=2126181 RepID=A0A8H6WHD4_9AGAR|nr:CCHC-type domain-containing protein [Mycena indigotica]KAF7314958.1 CCHC-type domain-containing protein [Mycena indigotica]
MKLRSQTKKVPQVASSGSDSRGSEVEMDASKGTSTVAGGNGKGLSAKSLTEGPRSVSDAGARSLVGAAARDSPSGAVRSEQGLELEPADGSAVPSTHDNGNGNTVSVSQMADVSGPTHPLVSAHSASSRGKSDTGSTRTGVSPRIGKWLEETERQAMDRHWDWADSTDEDDLGEIPTFTMVKKERVSPKLMWSPPVDNNETDFSPEFWIEIVNNLTLEDQRKLARRAERLKSARITEGNSISESTQQQVPKPRVDPRRARVEEVEDEDDPMPTLKTPESSQQPSLPRIPAVAKGKGRAATERTNIVQFADHISEDERAADERRLHQIEADALLALKLQDQLQEPEDIPRYVPPARRDGPRQGTSKAHAAEAVNEQIDGDAIFARELQEAFDARAAREMADNPEGVHKPALEIDPRLAKKLYKKAAREEPQELPKHKHKSKSTSADKKSSTPAPRKPESSRQNAPAPVAPTSQLPKSSTMYSTLNTGHRSKARPPSPSDSSSSSDSDSESDSSLDKRTRRQRKNRKRKERAAKKGKRKSKKKRNGAHDSDPSSSSSSSSSNSSSSDGETDSSETSSDSSVTTNSDWELFNGPPSLADSSASTRTKRQKQRDREKYRSKMAQLKMEQSNIKPTEPKKYTGINPKFESTQDWMWDVQRWCSDSYIRPKMRAHHAGRFLEGPAREWYQREVGKKAKKWSLRRLFQGMFDTFFPVDFYTQQRERFREFKQRGLPIKEYNRKLEAIANSIGGIRKQDYVRQFWRGADLMMRTNWAYDGYTQETAKLKQLIKTGINYQMSKKIGDQEKKTDNDGGASGNRKDTKRESKFRDRKRGSRQEGARNDNSEKPDKSQSKPQQRRSNNDQRTQSGSRDKPRDKKRHTLSKEEMNEYRAQGKCFTCGSTGHLSKDCPENNRLRPKTQLNAASVEQTGHLSDLREAIPGVDRRDFSRVHDE